MGGATWSTSPTRPTRSTWRSTTSPRPAPGVPTTGRPTYGGPKLGGDSLTLYASDGVHDPAAVRQPVGGFDVLRVDGLSTEVSFDHLNPQTQESVIGG